MLTKNDELQMHALMAERDDFRYLIEKLQEEHQYTVSQMSHEIRNPVALINSSLQLIEKQHSAVRHFACWTQVMEDLKYLRCLLDELSSFNNGERLKLKEISVKEFLTSIASSIEIYLSRKSIRFSSELQDCLPCIQADETKLHQALSNLLRNASEATEKNGRIVLRASVKDSVLLIEIEDNGCGIKPEYLDTLFSPFVTHKKSGSGLGLAITKRIIRAHSGTINVSSIPGSGSVFTISLPC